MRGSLTVIGTHQYKEQAVCQARNMARLNHGQEYTVLQSVVSVTIEPERLVEYDHGDYPF